MKKEEKDKIKDIVKEVLMEEGLIEEEEEIKGETRGDPIARVQW